MTNDRLLKFDAFVKEVREVLAGPGAQEYGETAEVLYATLGPGAPAQAVIEKGIRYGRQGNPRDLVKAAAYAFLGWSVTELKPTPAASVLPAFAPSKK